MSTILVEIHIVKHVHETNKSCNDRLTDRQTTQTNRAETRLQCCLHRSPSPSASASFPSLSSQTPAPCPLPSSSSFARVLVSLRPSQAADFCSTNTRVRHSMRTIPNLKVKVKGKGCQFNSASSCTMYTSNALFVTNQSRR